MRPIRNLNKTFFTGFIALLPIMATLYLFFWVMGAAEGVFGNIIKFFLPNQWYRPGMGVAASLIMIFMVGAFMESWFIKSFAGKFEDVICRVPLVKSIYRATREFVSFLRDGQSKGLRQVVAYTFANNITMLGFVTKRDLSFIKNDITNGKVAVYFPLSYQIGGYTIIVPTGQLTPLDMPMEQAMRFVMTAGIIEKENQTNQNSPS